MTRLADVANVPHLSPRTEVTKDRGQDSDLVNDRPTWKAGIVVPIGNSILVVEGLSETTEVLRAVFEPRGHAVRRVRQTQLAENSVTPPGVVVWHTDDPHGADMPIRPSLSGVPRIFISKKKTCDPVSPEARTSSRQFSQPFQYRELLDAIESLLQGDSGPA